jgi:methylmalonyl-CoA/ethylmalonyl-CoA epimerase
LKLHHVGIVVECLKTWGAAYARGLGLAQKSEVFRDPIQKVGVQFWGDEGTSLLEMIEPDSPDSPAWREMKKGGGLSHLCYEVEDMERRVGEAVADGAVLVVAPVPAVAFSGRRVAFLYYRKLGLIEFLERTN